MPAGFSPDGKTLVAACDSGEATLWDVASRTPLDRRFPHPGAVSAVAFSPDGKTLLTGCEDNLCGSGTSRPGRSASRLCRHTGGFLPWHSVLTAGACSRARAAVTPARLWDTATGTPIGPPLPLPSGVIAAAFSPDSESVLTGSYDGTARLFHMFTELPDDLPRVSTWVSVLTGLALDEEKGSIRVLDNTEWLERRDRLEHLGGSPECGNRDTGSIRPRRSRSLNLRSTLIERHSRDRHTIQNIVRRSARRPAGRGVEADGHALPGQDNRVVRSILNREEIAVLADDARIPDRADRHREVERQGPADDRRGARVRDRDIAREPGPPVVDVGERRPSP